MVSLEFITSENEDGVHLTIDIMKMDSILHPIPQRVFGCPPFFPYLNQIFTPNGPYEMFGI
jgi:hypothetical protein